MERPSVRSETQGAVTTIILDRPDRRNAIDRPTAKALAAAFRAFERDQGARVAVLWGANGTFCAGADLKAVAAGPTRRRIHYGDGPMGPTRLRLSKPVIAAIAGYAVAGGFELALWGDLRVVEEDAVMGVFNRRWGIPLIDGGTVRLPALVGLGRALDLILTGRPVNAREALAIGLANRVVARGQARHEAEALAATIAAFPPHSVRSDRPAAPSPVPSTPLFLALRERCELTPTAPARIESERMSWKRAPPPPPTPSRRLALGARIPRRDFFEQSDESAEPRAHVACVAILVLARAKQLVGDVERRERQRRQRILDARALELPHALLEILREPAQIVRRRPGANRQRLAGQIELDPPWLAHSCGLSRSSLPMSFKIMSTWATIWRRSSPSRLTSRLSCAFSSRMRASASAARFTAPSSSVSPSTMPSPISRSAE